MLAFALASLFALSGAAGASAAIRFAAPGGTGPTPCAEQTNPCSLFDAASLAASSQPAGPGDEVILAPGTYTDTAGDLGAQNQILLDREVSLHGEAGKPRPVIVIEHGVLPALSVAFEDTVSHLEIDSAVAPSLIAIHGGTVDDLIARSSRSGGGIVCALTAGVLHDSACLSSGSRGAALGLEAVGTQSDFQEVAFLRNVTAVATGGESAGMKFQVTGTGGSRPIFAVNGIAVIARGTANDVVARGLSLDPGTPGTGADVELDLDHSDYANVLTQNDGGGGVVVVTDPNTEDNVTAPPLLAADGLHELRGSPTVDAGDTDMLSGRHDIDGQNRAIGFGPSIDIGADELGNGTTTDISCSPGPLKTGEAFACTATVTDNTGFAGPGGEMSFATDGQGRFEGTPCTLAEIPTTSASNCQFEYRPTRVGSGIHKLTVSYPGDATDDPSAGTASVAVAGTVVRFAAPGGTGAAPCADPKNPCSLFVAASKDAGTSKAEAGDEVVLAPGVYSGREDLGPTESINAEEGIALHGEAGRPRPLISVASNLFGGLHGAAGDVISQLEIRSVVSQEPFSMRGGIVENVLASSAEVGAIACRIDGGVLRDSACLASGERGEALASSSGSGAPVKLALRNVTALATGPKSLGLSFAMLSGTKGEASAKAVIAEGTAGDVRALARGPGSTISIGLENSEFDSIETLPEDGGVASVTAPGGAGNVVAAPQMAPDGVHELAGSPSVDRGIVDDLSGAGDIDGQLRVLGAAPDIGADELVDATATTLACAAPTVEVGKGLACTATVANTSGPTTPSGRVDFSSDEPGGFSNGASCALAPIGAGKASCQLTYTPTKAGSAVHRIAAAYTGDASGHEKSRATTEVRVTASRSTAPNTRLKRRPRAKSARRLAVFTFVSDQPGASFQCKLDRRPFRRCRSPFKAKVKPGRHSFRVRAVSRAGSADPTPVVFRWKVLAR